MKKIVILLFFCLGGMLVTAQRAQPPFRKEIDAFKKKDSRQAPPIQTILFVGSSSFTKWVDVQAYFRRVDWTERAGLTTTVTVLIPATNRLDEAAVRLFRRLRDERLRGL